MGASLNDSAITSDLGPHLNEKVEYAGLIALLDKLDTPIDFGRIGSAVKPMMQAAGMSKMTEYMHIAERNGIVKISSRLDGQ